MRWLLIALLVLLQAQVPAAAVAMDHGALQVASCHEMPAEPVHGDHGLPVKGKSVAHLCPGCSIPGTVPAVTPAVPLPPVPHAALRLAQLESLAVPPSIPPPRGA